MSDTLNAGQIIVTVGKPQRRDISKYTGSMAAAMEDAFFVAWDNIMKDEHNKPKPRPEMNDQVRLLFMAVANGVVKHLAANSSAFVITSSSGTSSLVIQEEPVTVI